MRGDDPEFDAWVDRARAGSFELAAQICGFRPEKGQEHSKGWRAGPCPDCGGTDRFAVHFFKRRFRCRGCDASGDNALSLALVGGAASFVEACEQLTGEPKPSRTRDETAEERAARLERRRKAEADALVAAERQARQIEADRQRSLESSDRLWGHGGALYSSPIVQYLGHRDIAPLPPGIENLRFVSDLPYYVEVDVERGGKIETELRVIHRGPGMIGRIQGPDGHTIGVHRTWFDSEFLADRPKGRPLLFHPQTGKPLKTKKVLGEQQGGAIRLIRGLDWRGGVPSGFPGDMIPPLRLFLAEGIETLLSVYFALWLVRSPLLDRAAFWCGINLGNLQNIQIPRPIKEAILLGDGDSDPAATAKAMWAAEYRFRQQGCNTARIFAPPGKDFNDLLRSRDTVPHLFDQLQIKELAS